MSQFTPLSEIKKSLNIDEDTEYESDSSYMSPQPSITKPRKKISKEPVSNYVKEEEPHELKNTVKDITICLIAFVVASNPFVIKKILGYSSLGSESILESDEIKEIVTKNLNWKGFGVQVIGFLIIMIILKLLSYFGIF